LIRGRVRPGHEVGERPDRWVPPGSENGAWARLLAAAAEGRGARLLGCSVVGRESSWATRERKERGEREQAAGERRSWAFGPKPEGRVLPFLFFYFPFFFKKNNKPISKYFSKLNLNSF